MNGRRPVGAIVVERKYFTCPSRESNPGRWINRQTLYHVAVKAGFYRKAVEVYHIPSPVTFSPAKLNFVPEVPGHRESFLMRLGELLPGSRVGYLRWAPLSPVGWFKYGQLKIIQMMMVYSDYLHGYSEIIYI